MLHILVRLFVTHIIQAYVTRICRALGYIYHSGFRLHVVVRLYVTYTSQTLCYTY